MTAGTPEQQNAYIPQMIALVQRLVERGVAYVAEDNSSLVRAARPFLEKLITRVFARYKMNYIIIQADYSGDSSVEALTVVK